MRRRSMRQQSPGRSISRQTTSSLNPPLIFLRASHNLIKRIDNYHSLALFSLPSLPYTTSLK
jgi:hypothetical protein